MHHNFLLVEIHPIYQKLFITARLRKLLLPANPFLIDFPHHVIARS
jgi:hypothetical protein